MIFPRLRLLPVYLNEGVSLVRAAKWTKQLLLVRSVQCQRVCCAVAGVLGGISLMLSSDRHYITCTHWGSLTSTSPSETYLLTPSHSTPA